MLFFFPPPTQSFLNNRPVSFGLQWCTNVLFSVLVMIIIPFFWYRPKFRVGRALTLCQLSNWSHIVWFGWQTELVVCCSLRRLPTTTCGIDDNNVENLLFAHITLSRESKIVVCHTRRNLWRMWLAYHRFLSRRFWRLSFDCVTLSAIFECERKWRVS